MSYGSECPSQGVYARVTEVKLWIQFIAEGAVDSNCQEIPYQPGNQKNQESLASLSFIFAALLVTGGSSYYDGDAQHTAEVILPSGRSCSLPRLPSPGREQHTQSGLTACGGEDDEDKTTANCLTFDGEWEQSHTLGLWGYHDRFGRMQHVSWRSPLGIHLLGGFSSRSQTSELLSPTSSTTSRGFSLPYPTV